MNNSNLIRPGNLPIKEKILLPVNNQNNSPNNHMLNQQLHNPVVGDLGHDKLYDEKNPDVVPYNKGELNQNNLPKLPEHVQRAEAIGTRFQPHIY